MISRVVSDFERARLTREITAKIVLRESTKCPFYGGVRLKGVRLDLHFTGANKSVLLREVSVLWDVLR